MSSDPRPRLITGQQQDVDFVKQFGQATADGAQFEGLPPVNGQSPYRLVNPPGLGLPPIYSQLRSSYPLPAPLSEVDLCPVISIGRKGTGQIDLARHYHALTVMLLLQGQKIWALRPPSDSDCAAGIGDCTNPMDVCAYYARPGAPPPACVQLPGETIVLPDGWYHGTCNNASWTAGWGGAHTHPAAQQFSCASPHPLTPHQQQVAPCASAPHDVCVTRFTASGSCGPGNCGRRLRLRDDEVSPEDGTEASLGRHTMTAEPIIGQARGEQLLCA